MSPRHYRASRTAEYMAFFRALETRAPAERRLFSDPQAELFLSRPLRALARAAALSGVRLALCRLVDGLWPGARPSGVARTRLIDDALCRAVRDGVRQLVVLGAGFDSRGFRLPQLVSARIFELDHPHTAAEKRRRLARAGLSPPGHIVGVEADLLDAGWSGQLIGAGFDPNAPAFFLCEGVTNYLSARAFFRLLESVSATLPDNELLFTYVHSGALVDTGSFQSTGLLPLTLRRAGEPWTFGLCPEELGDVLGAHGLTLVWDRGSEEFRAGYWGARGRHMRGYAFYRAALARVAPHEEEVPCRR